MKKLLTEEAAAGTGTAPSPEMALLALFLPEVETLMETEAKVLGRQLLPKFIAMLQSAEAKLGNPTIIQVTKFFEEKGEQALTTLAQKCLDWCNE
jgi:hypothetical protein